MCVTGNRHMRNFISQVEDVVADLSVNKLFKPSDFSLLGLQLFLCFGLNV